MADQACPVPTAPSLGMLLRSYRQAQGLSARALSLSSGLSESYCGKVESGVMEPSFRAIAKIMKRLGLTRGEIAVLVLLESGGQGT